jgi:hypothetical protein
MKLRKLVTVADAFYALQSNYVTYITATYTCVTVADAFRQQSLNSSVTSPENLLKERNLLLVKTIYLVIK